MSMESVVRILGYSLQNFKAGDAKLALNREEFKSLPKVVDVWSLQFENGGTMPIDTTKLGENKSPALEFKLHPSAKEVKSLMLLLQDPDAPLFQVSTHTFAYNIDPSNAIFEINELAYTPDPTRFKFGGAMLGRQGYNGPRPPPGHGPHHYHFQVFALNETATEKLNSYTEKIAWGDALQAISGNVVGVGNLIGIFESK